MGDMGQQGTVAPPPSQGQPSGQPTVDTTAVIHPFAQIAGAITVGPQVQIAPGVLVHLEGDAQGWIGAGTQLQTGVMVRGDTPSRVLGDDDRPYGIWLGANVAIAAKALLQGPLYVGEGSFIGCRSTVFNARLGRGVIVMMHALVQDVEIPPGRYVPSGAVVTDQAQADSLPLVEPGDQAVVADMMGAGAAPWLYPGRADTLKPTANPPPSPRSAPSTSQVLSSLGPGTASPPTAAPYAAYASASPQAGQFSTPSSASPPSSYDNGSNTMQSQRLSADIVQQVRHLLSQGYRIGTEHADARRFKSNVWQTCSPIAATQEGAVFAALEACLGEHRGEYVRMFGIDPVAKKRVAAVTIQRPDGKPVEIAQGKASVAAMPTASQGHYRPQGGSGLSPEVVQQVRGLLRQGYRIGTEHADARRFRSNVWQTCSPIEATHESAVMSALAGCLQEHAGEYVRMFGIDPKAKKRVAPITIQRPDDGPAAGSGGGSYGASVPVARGNYSGGSGGGLSPEVVQQIRAILSQGFRIGAEHADDRHFRSNVWQTCTPIDATHEQGAIAAIIGHMQAHPNEYLRIYGIDPVAKQRHNPITVQRPGEAGVSSSPAPQSVPSHNGYGGYDRNSSHHQNGAAAKVQGDVAQQVQQLVNQGYRVSLEYADVRRYRSGAWQTGGILEGRGSSEVLAALEANLRAHSDKYVRLIGFDPQAKRRVLETTIQRP